MHLSTTPQDFLDQSLLLIQARPATTRITTTYSNPSRRRIAEQRERQKSKSAKTSEPGTTQTREKLVQQATGKLTLKAYDPISGACIKFITNKLSDVGRLVGTLGRAAREMGGLPQEKEVKADTILSDAPLILPPNVDSPVPPMPLPLKVKTPIPAAGAAQSGTGGKGKKKKGKK